ncbi:hypothetical protein F5Y08DRAFT_324541 [Xylaria arbuscula]|nr:hypothetical protein F5Y08DRAFT_324541 [Xylaria arbuscula]
MEPYVPEFLVGGQPQHLSLGYGWTIAIKRHDSCNIVLISASCRLRSVCSCRIVEFGNTTHPWYVDFDQKYYEALQRRDANFFADAHRNPLVLLLPVLELHAAFLAGELNHADTHFLVARTSKKIKKMDCIENAWGTLRIMRHEGMNPLKCIELCARSNGKGEIMESEEFKNLKERFQRIEDQISCTEALARDYLQYEVGKASLEESRASIKQARISLEESRRTKLITVLAIFFVPISLSTSVFGMNIHELNENGQSLWVFLVTTVLIMAVTLIIWGTMYQWQKYNSLPRRSFRERKSGLTRFYCFLLLIFHGHSVWAWKSGILVSLLTDGRVAFLRSCTDHSYITGAAPSSHDAHDPCTYVKGHLQREVRDSLESNIGFRNSDLEDP